MGVINQIAKMMQQYPDINLSVEGHTDSDGDEAMNKQLSEQRAETVKNKLIESGISNDRLASKGFGEDVHVADNTTPEGKANNRRVEFVKM
jgi:outer membrane protein OmpA-like peptidoglycan-associated protein